MKTCAYHYFLKIHTFLSKVHKNLVWYLFKALGLCLLDSLHPDGKSETSSGVLMKTLTMYSWIVFLTFCHLRVLCFQNGKWLLLRWRRRIKVFVWASLVSLWQHIRAERTPPKINIFTNHTRAWPTASLAQDQSSESSKHINHKHLKGSD